MAKAKESKPKPYLHVPIQRSSSVSASPINSNLKSLREWANFRWAAERPRKKDLMITWVLVLSQGLEDIYSSSGRHSCRALLSTCEEAQPNSCAKRPTARNLAHSLSCFCLPLCTLAQSRGWGNVYSSLRDLTAVPRSLKHFPLLCSLRPELQNFRLWLGTRTR